MNKYDLTEDILVEVFGKGLNKDFIEESILVVNTYRLFFGLSKRIDMIRFLAQVKHEAIFVDTKEGRVPMLEENLNFSDKRLFELSSYWRKHKKELKKVRKLGIEEQKRAIVDKWYKDGYDWVGHGCLMVTGKENTIKCLKLIEQVTQEKLLTDDKRPKQGIFKRFDIWWLLGMAYWRINHLYACNGSLECTNRINNGLPTKDKHERVRTAVKLNSTLFINV